MDLFIQQRCAFSAFLPLSSEIWPDFVTTLKNVFFLYLLTEPNGRLNMGMEMSRAWLFVETNKVSTSTNHFKFVFMNNIACWKLYLKTLEIFYSNKFSFHSSWLTARDWTHLSLIWHLLLSSFWWNPEITKPLGRNFLHKKNLLGAVWKLGTFELQQSFYQKRRH